MQVLNVIQCTNLGGMEQASLRLMRTLQERGYRFEVLSLNPLGGLSPLLLKAGVPASGLPGGGRGGWRALPALVKGLVESEADALMMTGHHLLASIASWAVPSKRSVLAIHFHHTGVKPPWQWRLIYAVACLRFDYVTFPTDFIRHEAELLYAPLRAKARTIRNAIPLPVAPSLDDRRLARQALGLPLHAKIVGNAGWLIPRKRWDVFFYTAREVLFAHPDSIFLIAGDGPERAQLETLTRELNISAHVRWLGWQQDLSAFYCSLDVLLFHSDWDALGLTPLEAMSYGIPVVASVENGGLQEILRNGPDGVLLTRHDVDQLARSVVVLLSDDELRGAMSEAGRRRIADTCDPRATAAAYAQLFESI